MLSDRVAGFCWNVEKKTFLAALIIRAIEKVFIKLLNGGGGNNGTPNGRERTVDQNRIISSDFDICFISLRIAAI